MIVFAVILAVLVGAAYGFLQLIVSGLTASALRRPLVKVAISALLLAGAIVLYAIKKSSAQPLYGLTEVAVGLVANWYSLEGLAKQIATADQDASGSAFTRLAVLGGGMYLIGRGIANVVEGMDQPSSMSTAPRDEGAKTG